MQPSKTYPLMKIDHGYLELCFDPITSPRPIIVYPPRAISCRIRVVVELGDAELLRSAMASEGRLTGHSRRQESQETKCETERHYGGGIFRHLPGTPWWKDKKSGNPSNFN